MTDLQSFPFSQLDVCRDVFPYHRAVGGSALLVCGSPFVRLHLGHPIGYVLLPFGVCLRFASYAYCCEERKSITSNYY